MSHLFFLQRPSGVLVHWERPRYATNAAQLLLQRAS